MTDDEKKEAATQFTDEWKNDDDQHCGSKAFWISLFRDVYGIEHAENFVEFEYKFGAIGIVDVYIPTIHMIIEQKGRNTNTNVLNATAKSIIDKIATTNKDLDEESKVRYFLISNYKVLVLYSIEDDFQKPLMIDLNNLNISYKQLPFERI
ncbi:MAG: hypothetical protein J5965_23420 [Aeriscardovia sp.]|nr:hypothetical protein [Aeriscardovia sp.]